MNLDRYRALLLDMDGTLIDNMGYHGETWRRFFGSKGFDWAEDAVEVRARTHGTIEEIVRRNFGEHLSEAEVQRLAEEKEGLYRELYAPHLAPLPGLREFLDQSRGAGLKMALATAGGAPNIAFVLNGLDLQPYFAAIVGGEDVAHGKPAPDVYLQSADKLGVPPSECLVFEDSPEGVESARRAGMDCVVLSTMRPAPDFSGLPNVRRVVADYSELLQV